MLNYYVCENKNCNFRFERHGECSTCPNCGKEQVRLAGEREIAEYLKAKNEK